MSVTAATRKALLEIAERYDKIAQEDEESDAIVHFRRESQLVLPGLGSMAAEARCVSAAAAGLRFLSCTSARDGRRARIGV